MRLSATTEQRTECGKIMDLLISPVVVQDDGRTDKANCNCGYPLDGHVYRTSGGATLLIANDGQRDQQTVRPRC